MTHDVRLVAIDVDGTLTDAQDRIGDATVAAVRAAAAGGVRIVVATGRAPHGCDQVLARLAVPAGLVAVNGAVVYERFGAAPWASRLLSPETAWEVVAAMVAAGLAPLIWDDPAITDGIVHDRPGLRYPGFLDDQRQRVRPWRPSQTGSTIRS